MMENNLLLAVNGTLMRGLELENNLKEAGATFIKESQTAKAYRLFSINDRYPAMIKDENGNNIAVEIYQISKEGLESVVSKEPPGLEVKEIILIDGEVVLGVMGKEDIIKGQKEITTFGGWRNYLNSIKENKMKKIFIYYSLSGNGEVVAQEMAKKGYDLRKVETKKGLPKVFFFAMMSGGFQAAINKKAKLKDFDNDISSYDEVVIGSPIWNARFAPAVNTALSLLDLKDKKVSFVFYSGSGEGKKALKRIQKEYSSASYVFLKQPKDNLTELEKLVNL